MGSRLIGASDDGERPTSPSNPHASPREPPHSWFSFSLSYIPSISSPPIARAVRGTRRTMRWKLVKQRISIRGGYGSRCDVCLRVVILTILPLSTSPPPSCTIPCGIVTLVQIKKKGLFHRLHVRSVIFSRLIPFSYFTSTSFLLVHC